MFGAQFESIELTSNRGMTTVIREISRDRAGRGSLQRPDLVVLPFARPHSAFVLGAEIEAGEEEPRTEGVLLDGYELMRQIRARESNENRGRLVTIAVTAYARPEDR